MYTLHSHFQIKWTLAHFRSSVDIGVCGVSDHRFPLLLSALFPLLYVSSGFLREIRKGNPIDLRLADGACDLVALVQKLGGCGPRLGPSLLRRQVSLMYVNPFLNRTLVNHLEFRSARHTHWFTFTVITDADGTVDRTTSLLASVMPMIQTMNARNTLNPHLNKRTPPSPQSQSVPAPLTEAASHSQPHPAQRKGAIWKLSRIPRLLMLGYATDERQRRLVSVLFYSTSMSRL